MVDDTGQADDAEELDSHDGGGRFNFHVSRLLLVSVLGALASTVMVLVVWAGRNQDGGGGPPPGGGPGGGPPPGQVTDLLVITTAIFVVAWVAVLVALARDHVNRRLARLPDRAALEAAARQATSSALASLREVLKQDRKVEQAASEERITAIIKEYGDERETQGYVRGLHESRQDPGRDDPGGGGAQVRPLRRS